MKNETKLLKLKSFLDDNNINYIVPKKAGRMGHSDLVLPVYRICIKMQGDDDEVFYQRHKVGRYPVFIRKEETPKFIIEKVQNTIIKAMTNYNNWIMKRRNGK